MKKIKINDIVPLFPTDKEIEKVAKSYENSPLASIAESIFFPSGFKEGAKWSIEKIKKNLEKVD